MEEKRIVKMRFMTSLLAPGPFEGRGLPEIAVAGKSNVGKSSMINCLAGRNGLARVSQEPGKTRMLNLFSLNDAAILVDLPGYGFAKVSKDEKARWAGMIEGYLRSSPYLKHALLLVDMRHDPTNEDRMMADYLRHYRIPFTVIATKADKLSGAQRGRCIPPICRGLIVQPWEIIPFSSENNTGRDPALETIWKAAGLE